MQVDVVILNWLRPDHLQSYLIPTLLTCPEVGRIIISHGRRDTYFDYSDARVISLDHSGLNEALGLALRFHCHSEVRTEAALILDDDLFIEPAHVAQLVASYRAKPGHIHGYDARYVMRARDGLIYTRMRRFWRHLGDPVYLRHLLFGRPRPVITLTKSLVAPTSAMAAFMEQRHLVEDFVRERSRPFWNGEDIVMNLIHVARTGRLPVILKPCRPRRQTKQSKAGISSAKGHYRYRSELVRIAAEKLGLTF